MQRFGPGDRVRIDIPDESDPDYDRYHDSRGTVIDVSEDAASDLTGDPRDAVQYRVELDTDRVADFRWRDLRPVRRKKE
jgi:hypothetical protein